MSVKGKVINTRRLGWVIIIGAITLEFAARAFSFWGLNRPFWDDRKFLPDRYVIWKLHPGYKGVWTPLFRHLEVNRQGLIGPEISQPKGQDVLRIIIIGGSVTFGYGTPHPDSTCRSLVEALLQKRADGRRYEVLNASAPWAGLLTSTAVKGPLDPARSLLNTPAAGMVKVLPCVK